MIHDKLLSYVRLSGFTGRCFIQARDLEFNNSTIITIHPFGKALSGFYLTTYCSELKVSGVSVCRRLNTYHTTTTLFYKNAAFSWWERLPAAIIAVARAAIVYRGLKPLPQS
jgi:hypothetical protein